MKPLHTYILYFKYDDLTIDVYAVGVGCIEPYAQNIGYVAYIMDSSITMLAKRYEV